VGRSIRYEYGGGVDERGRLSFVFWAITCLILFASSAAAPRVLQHFGLLFTMQEAEVARATERAPAVALQQSVPQPDKEVDATVPVDARLQKLIEQWVGRNPDQAWGVSVEVLGDKPVLAQHQPLLRMYPASLYKLLITQSLSEKVSADEWDKRTVYDYRGSHTYSQCVDLMIRLSDNACGEAVGNAIGWPKVDGRLVAIGLENTKLNSADNRFTTAADMSRFIRLLYEEPILSHRAKDQVMSAMKVQKFRDGIPAGSPDCTVYDKIGDLDGYKHDVALVECGDVTYSLAILSKGGSYKQIAELAKTINSHLIR
jgi:beta-lactamase class A